MTALRVAVVCGRIGDLDPVQAGTALARGIAGQAQVALAPVAAGGPDLASAVAALTGGELHTQGRGWLVRWPGAVLVGFAQPEAPSWAPGATTSDVGEWIAASVGGAQRVVLDLTGVTAHDGGTGLLATAGAALAGRELVGLVAADELDLPATGIGGGLARRAFAGRVDVAELLAADAVLAARAGSLGEGLATARGGGAAGGSRPRRARRWRNVEHRYAVLPPTGRPRRDPRQGRPGGHRLHRAVRPRSGWSGRAGGRGMGG